jgi:hypothetical protein
MNCFRKHLLCKKLCQIHLERKCDKKACVIDQNIEKVVKSGKKDMKNCTDMGVLRHFSMEESNIPEENIPKAGQGGVWGRSKVPYLLPLRTLFCLKLF